jgi:DNA polymerase-3 subunit beta
MKFVVSSKYLLNQLSTINGVIPSNPVLPILENFLFEIKDEKLSIKASDLQISMVTEMEIEANQDGSIAIPAKILVNTLKNLPDQPITFTVDPDTFSVEIRAAQGTYKICGENAVDFPTITPIEKGNKIEIESDVLLKAIKNTIFCTSNDDLRPAMQGVLFELTPDGFVFVATDGHRLVRYTRTDVASKEEAAIIMPKKALNLLQRILGNDTGLVMFSFNDSHAHFKVGDVQLMCRLIDERFPDYKNAIPLNNANQLVIRKGEWLSSLERIAVYANRITQQIKMKLEPEKLTMLAEDLDYSNEAKEVLIAEYTGEEMEIGFNAGFLTSMLSHIDENEVEVKMSTPNRAALIVPKDKSSVEDILMLVMPVMLNNYY